MVAQLLCIELCPKVPTLLCVVMPMLLPDHQAVVLLATHRVLQHSSRRGEGRHLAEHNAPEHWWHAYCRRECALGLLGRGMNDSGLRWPTPLPVCTASTQICALLVCTCVFYFSHHNLLLCVLCTASTQIGALLMYTCVFYFTHHNLMLCALCTASTQIGASGQGGGKGRGG